MTSIHQYYILFHCLNGQQRTLSRLPSDHTGPSYRFWLRKSEWMSALSVKQWKALRDSPFSSLVLLYNPIRVPEGESPPLGLWETKQNNEHVTPTATPPESERNAHVQSLRSGGCNHSINLLYLKKNSKISKYCVTRVLILGLFRNHSW